MSGAGCSFFLTADPCDVDADCGDQVRCVDGFCTGRPIDGDGGRLDRDGGRLDRDGGTPDDGGRVDGGRPGDGGPGDAGRSGDGGRITLDGGPGDGGAPTSCLIELLVAAPPAQTLSGSATVGGTGTYAVTSNTSVTVQEGASAILLPDQTAAGVGDAVVLDALRLENAARAQLSAGSWELPQSWSILPSSTLEISSAGVVKGPSGGGGQEMGTFVIANASTVSFDERATATPAVPTQMASLTAVDSVIELRGGELQVAETQLCGDVEVTVSASASDAGTASLDFFSDNSGDDVIHDLNVYGAFSYASGGDALTVNSLNSLNGTLRVSGDAEVVIGGTADGGVSTSQGSIVLEDSARLRIEGTANLQLGPAPAVLSMIPGGTVAPQLIVASTSQNRGLTVSLANDATLGHMTVSSGRFRAILADSDFATVDRVDLLGGRFDAQFGALVISELVLPEPSTATSGGALRALDGATIEVSTAGGFIGTLRMSGDGPTVRLRGTDDQQAPEVFVRTLNLDGATNTPTIDVQEATTFFFEPPDDLSTLNLVTDSGARVAVRSTGHNLSALKDWIRFSGKNPDWREVSLGVYGDGVVVIDSASDLGQLGENGPALSTGISGVGPLRVPLAIYEGGTLTFENNIMQPNQPVAIGVMGSDAAITLIQEATTLSLLGGAHLWFRRPGAQLSMDGMTGKTLFIKTDAAIVFSSADQGFTIDGGVLDLQDSSTVYLRADWSTGAASTIDVPGGVIKIADNASIQIVIDNPPMGGGQMTFDILTASTIQTKDGEAPCQLVGTLDGGTVDCAVADDLADPRVQATVTVP